MAATAQSNPVVKRLLDFGFENIDLWRSEEMSLVQVGARGFHTAPAAMASPRCGQGAAGVAPAAACGCAAFDATAPAFQ